MRLSRSHLLIADEQQNGRVQLALTVEQESAERLAMLLGQPLHDTRRGAGRIHFDRFRTNPCGLFELGHVFHDDSHSTLPMMPLPAGFSRTDSWMRPSLSTSS